MFQKLVAIEPVSLVLSAEKALYSFADEVVMYSDIPSSVWVCADNILPPERHMAPGRFLHDSRVQGTDR